MQASHRIECVIASSEAIFDVVAHRLEVAVTAQPNENVAVPVGS